VRQVQFTCFAVPDSVSAILRASGTVYIFCDPRLVFGGNEGGGSRFHFSRARTHFRRYRGRHVSFSCFARPDSFSVVPTASGLVYMFCAPGLFFGGTEGVGSRFHVLRARTRFRRYRERRLPCSCFALTNSFSAVPRASGPVFIFCSPGLIFGDTEGVGSLVHVLRSRTRFRRYRGHRVPFSCLALPDSFSAVSSTLGPVFMFCAHVLIFSGTEGVWSRFYVLRARTRFRRYGGRRVPFSCFRSRTHFRRYRWRRVPFSCFACPELFSAVRRVSSHVFMFCAAGLVFGGTKGIGSRFHVLRNRTRLPRY
jgi:hypothetical protein